MGCLKRTCFFGSWSMLVSPNLLHIIVIFKYHYRNNNIPNTSSLIHPQFIFILFQTQIDQDLWSPHWICQRRGWIRTLYQTCPRQWYFNDNLQHFMIQTKMENLSKHSIWFTRTALKILLFRQVDGLCKLSQVCRGLAWRSMYKPRYNLLSPLKYDCFLK